MIMNTHAKYYLTSDRDTGDQLKKHYENILSENYLQAFINALPNIVTILNDKRQIIFSNNALVEQLHKEDFYALLGERPGEAVGCIHSNECDGGCGSSESCRLCGALTAIRESMRKNILVSRECTITTRTNDEELTLDFEATASPFTLNGETYTIFSLTDISSTKRRRMLEQIFFHDILNTAGNIRGIAEILPDLEDNAEKVGTLLKLLKNVSNELVEEILAQKDLLSAEAGELKPKPEQVNTREIMKTVTRQFTENPAIRKQTILNEDNEEFMFLCDRTLLIRVLKNMLKNALEATRDNKPVLFSVRKNEEYAVFSVHNYSYMPREVQLQVFTRNFSTKGSGRGLGTYSMRLIGEKYLNGKVGFETEQTKGTTFYVKLPLAGG